MVWNINGLTDAKSSLHDYFDYFQKFDVILLSETRSQHVDDRLFQGFSVSYQPSTEPSQAGQGLVVAVRRSPLYGIQDWCSDASSLWMRLVFRDNSFPPLHVGSV